MMMMMMVIFTTQLRHEITLGSRDRNIINLHLICHYYCEGGQPKLSYNHIYLDTQSLDDNV